MERVMIIRALLIGLMAALVLGCASRPKSEPIEKAGWLSKCDNVGCTMPFKFDNAALGTTFTTQQCLDGIDKTHVFEFKKEGWTLIKFEGKVVSTCD